MRSPRGSQAAGGNDRQRPVTRNVPRVAGTANQTGRRRVTRAVKRREGSIMGEVTKAGREARCLPMTVLAALAACILTLGLVAAACGDAADERPAAPSGQPSITGTITSAADVTHGDIVGSFLVEVGRGDYGKASVTVTVKTGWFRRDGS